MPFQVAPPYMTAMVRCASPAATVSVHCNIYWIPCTHFLERNVAKNWPCDLWWGWELLAFITSCSFHVLTCQATYSCSVWMVINMWGTVLTFCWTWVQSIVFTVFHGWWECKVVQQAEEIRDLTTGGKYVINGSCIRDTGERRESLWCWVLLVIGHCVARKLKYSEDSGSVLLSYPQNVETLTVEMTMHVCCRISDSGNKWTLCFPVSYQTHML
jgi:hypothetical protein